MALARKTQKAPLGAKKILDSERGRMIGRIIRCILPT